MIERIFYFWIKNPCKKNRIKNIVNSLLAPDFENINIFGIIITHKTINYKYNMYNGIYQQEKYIVR